MTDNLAWVKSSYTGSQGNCVEVARNLPGAVAVRDSKNPEGPRLVFAGAAWRRFAEGLKTGQGDQG
jgi:hypothetical protein